MTQSAPGIEVWHPPQQAAGMLDDFLGELKAKKILIGTRRLKVLRI